jgi:hypothetical protein
MKKGINKYLGAFVMGTALLAVPSCTDTWSEHYLTEDAYTANESLWEVLEGREDLSNFREIIEKAKFYRDEHHPAFTIEGEDTVYYTFKDVLNGNTPVTVWAPANEAMTQEEWDKFAAMAETDGYNLQQQFLGNHIALYRKTMTKSGQETFRLINSKFATVNYDDSKLQKSNVVEKNIGARNGLLHVLESQNEFLFNLYEYIKFSGEVNTFSEYLVKRDTLYFEPSKSIEGLPDENGNPTYVDSVYVLNNMMFDMNSENPTSIDANDAWMNNLNMFHAQLNTEDSAFVMIVPTDIAWETVTNKLKPYYKYVSTYPRMDKTKIGSTKASTSSIFGARKSYENGKGYETVDSLQDVNINMDIITPLVFNVNLQPNNGTVWTLEKFMKGGYRECEYLLTTVGDTIRDVYEEINGIKTLVWSKNSLFEDASVKEQKEMSNGYAIVSDKWNYPRSYWMRDIDVDASVFKTYDKSAATNTTEFDINNTISKDWIDEYGRCSEQKYLQVSGRSASTNPEIVFALEGSKQGYADAMSGKYDVQIVLVPRWYETSQDGERDTTAVVYKNRLICTLYYWDESLIGGSDLKYTKQNKIVSDKIEYNGEKVDTITVLTDVEFPVSYKNLLQAHPVLHITSDKISKDDEKANYNRTFNIDRIILKSKEAEL